MSDHSTTSLATPRRPAPDPAAGPPPVNARWSRRKLLTAAGVITAAAMVVVWLVAFSPVLGAQHVRVVGVTGTAATEVIAAGAVPHGTALLRLDTAAVSERVRALPWVASATARTSFPTTVIIDVTPRVAVGYQQSTSGYQLLDRTGRAYQSVAKPPAGLPRFALPGGTAGPAAGEAAATVAAALSASERAVVAVIQARSADSITLVLRDQRTVVWGSVARSADKAALLPALLHRPGHTFDVSDPDLVVAH